MLDSERSGNGIFGCTGHEPGSMAVKVMVDSADQPAGYSAMLKLDGDVGESVYWCGATAQRCGIPADAPPIYGVAAEVDCAVCHSGIIFNAL